MSIISLPQETITVDDTDYLITAMPATQALAFMEKYQESLETGKADLSLVKQLVCKYVAKDNKQITSESFDILFARKAMGHLQRLYSEILKFNFEDVFQESDSED